MYAYINCCSVWRVHFIILMNDYYLSPIGQAWYYSFKGITAFHTVFQPFLKEKLPHYTVLQVWNIKYIINNLEITLRLTSPSKVDIGIHDTIDL